MKSLVQFYWHIGLLTLFLAAFNNPVAAQEPKVNTRPALPFPPGVSVESQCGAVDDLQDVELYDGTLGVSKDYVSTNEPTTMQFQWLDEASITSRLPEHSPGNVAGQRWCTGTLISDRFVLTAGHCFDSQASELWWVTPFKIGANGQPEYAPPAVIATLQVANFGYQVNKDTGTIRIPSTYPILRLVEHRLGNLDYAIVELGANASGELPGAHVSPAKIVLRTPRPNEVLGIIQHPQGLPKKIEAGRLLAVSGSSLLYDDIDTWGGSSGSGVRDATGGVIGVHTNGGCTIAQGEGANSGVDVQAISAVSDQF